MITGEIKAGDILYDVHSVRSGNSTMRRMAWWPVRVYAVSDDGRYAWTSWNSNPVCRTHMSTLRKHRRSIPAKLADGGSTKPFGSTFTVPDGWAPPVETSG